MHGTGVYMREGTTSRVTAAGRPYVKFHDFYSVSPENFGSTLVQHVTLTTLKIHVKDDIFSSSPSKATLTHC